MADASNEPNHVDYGDAAEFAEPDDVGANAGAAGEGNEAEAQGEANEAEPPTDANEGGGEDEVDADLAEMQRMMAEMEESNKEITQTASAASEVAASSIAAKADAEKQARERDERSVFVAGFDFSVTAEELGTEFESCGVVERVTILTDRMGHPKG
jgi:hypothetical protein